MNTHTGSPNQIQWSGNTSQRKCLQCSDLKDRQESENTNIWEEGKELKQFSEQLTVTGRSAWRKRNRMMWGLRGALKESQENREKAETQGSGMIYILRPSWILIWKLEGNWAEKRGQVRKVLQSPKKKPETGLRPWSWEASLGHQDSRDTQEVADSGWVTWHRAQERRRIKVVFLGHLLKRRSHGRKK